MASRGRQVGIAVEGLAEVKQNLAEFVKKLDDPEKTGKVFLTVAQLIRDDAKRRVAVRTGLLRANIFAGKRRTKIPSAVVGVRIKKVFYAWFVEYGTAHSPAKPFLRTAAAANFNSGLLTARDIAKEVYDL